MTPACLFLLSCSLGFFCWCSGFIWFPGSYLLTPCSSHLPRPLSFLSAILAPWPHASRLAGFLTPRSSPNPCLLISGSGLVTFVQRSPKSQSWTAITAYSRPLANDCWPPLPTSSPQLMVLPTMTACIPVLYRPWPFDLSAFDLLTLYFSWHPRFLPLSGPDPLGCDPIGLRANHLCPSCTPDMKYGLYHNSTPLWRTWLQHKHVCHL